MSRILDATAVVLMRKGGEVFWVRRSPRLSFMGGFYAFPGGRVDREDADPALIEAIGETHPATEGRYDLRFVACAFRELFEETGVLPCREGADRATLRRARKMLLEGERPFTDIVRSLGVTLDAGAFRYLGYRTTPPFSPRRFHAHFFLAFLPEGQHAEVWPGELVEGTWITPRAAIERWRKGEVLVAPPTLSAIEKLERFEGCEGLADHFQEADLPVPRIELRPGIYMLPLRTPTLPPATTTNCFVIGDRELVVIDPGSPWPEEQEKLDAMLDHFAQEGRFVREILLTHFHPDHVGGANHLRKRLGVPVTAHPDTIERLAGEVAIDRELPGIETNVIDLGRDPTTGEAWRLRAIHTPGHARGHLAFLDERFGTLLAGDMLAGIGTVVIDPPEGSMTEYLASLRKLQRFSLDLIFPAHGPMLADPAARLQEYLDHRQMREDRILARLAEGSASTADLLHAVYTDISESLFPLAERSLLAHLEKLLGEGRIEKRNDTFSLTAP